MTKATDTLRPQIDMDVLVHYMSRADVPCCVWQKKCISQGVNRQECERCLREEFEKLIRA